MAITLTDAQMTRLKTALRTTTTDENLEQEISDLVNAFALDAKLAGITNEDLDDPLVWMAAVTFVRLKFGSPDEYDRLKQAYDEQKAQISGAEKPTEEAETVFVELKYSRTFETSLTIYNGYFQGGEMNNKAEIEQMGLTEEITAFGGGVINSWHSVDVNVYGGTIVGGYAQSGGAIYISGGKADVGSAMLTLRNVSIIGGRAVEEAASVYIGTQTIVNIENVTVAGEQDDLRTVSVYHSSTSTASKHFGNVTVTGGLKQYLYVVEDGGLWKIMASYHKKASADNAIASGKTVISWGSIDPIESSDTTANDGAAADAEQQPA